MAFSPKDDQLVILENNSPRGVHGLPTLLEIFRKEVDDQYTARDSPTQPQGHIFYKWTCYIIFHPIRIPAKLNVKFTGYRHHSSEENLSTHDSVDSDWYPS